MSRIYAAYMLKRILNPFMVKLYGLSVVFIAVSTTLVSIPDVVSNFLNVASNGIPYSFIVSAFTHTELAVQVGSFVVLLLVIWMVRDMTAHGRVHGQHVAV